MCSVRGNESHWLNTKQHLQIFNLENSTFQTGIIYHGTQSSTSSDLSPPMSEQKSLPRRGNRSRYHHLHHLNTNTTPRHKSTTQSPLASPRSSCKQIATNNSQLVSNVSQYSNPPNLRMPSQFRPISRPITLTTNTTNQSSRLSPNC